MSTRLSSYAGSTSVSGIWPPHAMQTILVVIALGDRCVSMALPLPPTCFGANAKDANPKATVGTPIQKQQSQNAVALLAATRLLCIFLLSRRGVESVIDAT
jgi:hypothetical protein